MRTHAPALGWPALALTVTGMATQPNPNPPTPTTCAYCPHSLDEHVMVLVVESPPCGLMLCPELGCDCGSTWRAGTRRSTPTEIAETRELVRDALIGDGLPLPRFLR